MVGKCSIALVLALTLGLAVPAAQQTHTFIDATVSSESAADGGIAVRVAVPVTSRQVNGAPVAIFVPGGGGADAYQIREYAAGVISITFAFPGGEFDGRRSGGSADSRGPVALRALADVVQFALGRVRTTDGRLLRDLAPYPVLDNVGLVGWSRGGDAVINALARYADQTRGVRWIVTHESPAFDSAMTGEIVVRPGSASAPADYVPHTCALLACQVLYPNLRWEANSRTGGSLYLDRNGSGRPDLATEPALPGNLLPGTTRRVFTLAATEAALAGGVFGSRWPDNVATVAEASDYWAWRARASTFRRSSAVIPALPRSCTSPSRITCSRPSITRTSRWSTTVFGLAARPGCA